VMTQRKRVGDESGRNRRAAAWKCSKSNSARLHFAAKSDFRSRSASLEPPHFMSSATQGQRYHEDTVIDTGMIIKMITVVSGPSGLLSLHEVRSLPSLVISRTERDNASMTSVQQAYPSGSI
jgi:hypothetical protein